MLRISLVLAIAFTTCEASGDIDFAHDVVPILRQHCAECHSGDEAEGGFSFNTRRLLLESEAVIAGNPAQSRLIELISSTDSEEQMPPADRSRLNADEVSTLTQWIKEGAIWEPGFRFGSAGYEPPLLPRTVALPPEQFEGQHPIDRILAAYLQDNNVSQSGPINDRIFLRRISMDLLGLTPTIEQQRRFLGDDADDRRDRLIDSLLARDHDYAEHWLTFWNDLLRNDYKGTGYIDGGRKQITGWLYRALVSNKPYDQFVRELISPAEESEGFIRGIKWRGDVNASQVREIQFAQNVGQIFLGINMKCASCHDSFIDRWTLDESYGLAAIYSQRELEIHRCDKPTGRIAKAAWIFPELGQVDADAPQPQRLQQLSNLITHQNNGRFSRTIVNRLWHRLMGHGIVHPVDAMHTQPWNEDLLDYLANEFVATGYDIKHMLRFIVTSQAYQSAVIPAQDSATAGDFVYQGPIARHLTAEQFMDAVWHLTGAHPQNIDAPVAIEEYLNSSTTIDTSPGEWVWNRADAAQVPAGEAVEFTYILSVEELPQKATCVITCDNEYTLVVNDTKVGSDSNFTEPDAIPIGPYLHSGTNTIVIQGRNAGNSPNPAGLYADLILVDADGALRRVPSGPAWNATTLPADGQATGTPQPAIPVANQKFLGDKVNNRITMTINRVMAGTARPVRASMVNSNLLMRSLGRPNREQVVTTRPDSMSTLQAIDLANGEILDQTLAQGGRILASTLQSDADFVGTLFLSALCRPPQESERQLAKDLLGSTPDAQSVQDLLWTLIMLPEFQFVN